LADKYSGHYKYNSKCLEKVVLMKQIPRYDPSSVDPLSIKPALSQLYNNTLTDEWMNSQFKDQIMIGNYNIECSGSIKEARYRETKSNRFDGIHFLGSSGRKASTLSVLNILKRCGITSSDHDYHQSCAQYKYQRRQNTGNRQQSANNQTGSNRGTRQVYNKNGFSLHTQNRFKSLSNPIQGNWF
jgi:hypothetical protein